MSDDRHIQIGGDAAGNTVITGDGNVVIIQPPVCSNWTIPLPAPSIGPNPYQGLAAFTEKEADRFFGRETLTQKLWEVFPHAPRAAARPAATPALATDSRPLGVWEVVARPGWSPARPGPPATARAAQPRVVVLTPGTHPLEALAGVLACIATDDPAPVAKTREFAEELRKPGTSGAYDGLRRIAAALPGIAASPLIVLVDQYEELYTLCEDPRRRTC